MAATECIIICMHIYIARSILVRLPSTFLPIHLVSVHVVHPYNSIDTTAARKKLCFILSGRSDFYMTDSLSMVVHTFASSVLMSFSVDKMLLTRYVNLSTNFRDLPFSVEMSPLWLNHMNSVLSALTWRPISPAARSRLCSWDSAWVGVFVRSGRSSA